VIVLVPLAVAGIAAFASRSGSIRPLLPIPSMPHTPSPAGSTPAPTVKVEYQRMVGASTISATILGVVTNTSSVPVKVVSLTAVLHDEKGKEVGTASGFPAMGDLDPGESVPFKVWMPNAPKFSTVTYEPFVLQRDTSRAQQLRADYDGPTPRGRGSYVVTGSVHNDGTTPARYVQILLCAYDGAGRLLAYDTASVKARVIGPGDWSEFDNLDVDCSEKPAKFTVTVRGDVDK
jgi:hypothetical protein